MMKQQNCGDVLRELPFLLQDELSAEAKRTVRTHLDGCAACRRAYERLHKTFEVVQAGKSEPEDFEAFNRSLFQRLKEGRLSRTYLLKPIFPFLRPALLVPVTVGCLMLLSVGLWQRSQGEGAWTRRETPTAVVLLEALDEDLPEVEEETLTEELVLLDELLLASAESSPQETDVQKELEVLERLDEEEEFDEEDETLEEELLLSDQEEVG